MRLALISLSFVFAAACATGRSVDETSGPAASASSSGDCGPMTAAHAGRGAVVLSAPDSTANSIATLQEGTAICASKDSRGFGFRRVRLPDGRIGYIDEQNID
jgi:guanyl-specific ribonuclease Sa